MLGLFNKQGFKKYWAEVISLYDDLYYSSRIKNNSDLARRLEQQDDHIGIDFVGSYDGDNITFYYLIQGFPSTLMLDFKDRLRSKCREGVRLNFYNRLTGHSIDWNSNQMRNRLRILSKVAESNNESDVNNYNLHKNIGSMSRQQWIEDSLGYLAVADKKRKRALLKSSMLITISGKRGEDFDDSVDAIESEAKKMDLKLSRVLYNIPDLLRFFSPFSMKFNKTANEMVSTQVITDEIVARYSSYNQGTLGYRGAYFGTDVYSQFPVIKMIKPKDDSAENWLCTAETGGGKSFLIKAIILQLVALKYNGTIMDIEGFEYIPLAQYLAKDSKVVIVNMAEGDGKYFDPVEISDLTGIEDIDKDLKNMSLNFTLAVYKAILGRAYLEDPLMDVVLNEALSAVYEKKGITEDRESWKNSQGLTLHSIYAEFELLKNGKRRNETSYMEALNKVIAIAGKYFEPNGTKASLFKEKAVVKDIIDADLVVCSFGMAGKSPQSIDEVQLALMQLGAAQLSHQRSIFSKAQGKFNFKIWEEFQRWGKFPGSESTIGVAVTGGRKLGDVNIIITNDVKQILDDDRFSIFSNIQSFMAGAIKDRKVRHELCERLSIPNMIPEIDAIAKAVKVDDESYEGGQHLSVEDPLAFSFLMGLDNNKFGITKMILPDSIRKSKILKTGVDLQGTVE